MAQSTITSAASPQTSASSIPHPLQQLTIHESNRARQTVLKARGNVLLEFRAIYLQEPPKAQLVPFLEAEAAGRLSTATRRPTREAVLHYDVVHDDKRHEYSESVVDVVQGREVKHRVLDTKYQPYLTA